MTSLAVRHIDWTKFSAKAQASQLCRYCDRAATGMTVGNRYSLVCDFHAVSTSRERLSVLIDELGFELREEIEQRELCFRGEGLGASRWQVYVRHKETGLRHELHSWDTMADCVKHGIVAINYVPTNFQVEISSKR